MKPTYKRYMTPSVEIIPGVNAAAALVRDGSSVFRDDTDIMPVRINDREEYMPWGADNMMPYNIMELIEQDVTDCSGIMVTIYDKKWAEYNTYGR